MNKIKTFILGTAAATVAATGVQAADPIFDDVKAPAREPVYRCDITGFIELPGTDICFKVGGFMRGGFTAVDKSFAWTNADGSAGPYVGASSLVPGGVFGAADVPTLGERPMAGTDTVFFGENRQRTRLWGQGRVNFDARTDTEFGTVRGFAEFQANGNQGNTGGALNMRHAFVQFGNWTFGKAWSTFIHLGSSPNFSEAFTMEGDNFVRRGQIRYTQPFGNGFSVSVALEDQGFANRSGYDVWGPSRAQAEAGVLPATLGYDARERTGSMPDIVAAIDASGEWGSAKLSGLLHENRVRSTVGHPDPWAGGDSELGWAVLFGTNLNVPTTEGSNFSFKAVYADGASHVINAAGAGGNTVWGFADFFALDPDTPHSPSILDTVEAWSVLAAYQHFWTPTVSTTVGAGYSETDYGSVVGAGSALDGVFTGVPFIQAGLPTDKVKALQVSANVEWTPVSNTSFKLEGTWAQVDRGNYAGWQGDINEELMDLGAGPWASSKDDGFGVTFEVTRSF